MALLLNLSDNLPKQTQNNTVFLEEKKWTGWDLNPRPQPAFQGSSLYYFQSKVRAHGKRTVRFKSHPLHSLSICFAACTSNEVYSEMR
jgi:hypothetical protein